MDLPSGTLTELREAASKLDRRIRQREAKKRGHNTSSPSQQGTQHKDPDAMQVDATQQGGTKKTRADYIKFMNGKCYGCGSKDHTKKDGNHERDICNHCAKVGHRSNVCFTKYLGKPGKPKAKAAASTDSTDPAPSTSEAVSATAPAQDSKEADLLAKLMERVKAQEAQINALKVSF